MCTLARGGGTDFSLKKWVCHGNIQHLEETLKGQKVLKQFRGTRLPAPEARGWQHPPTQARHPRGSAAPPLWLFGRVSPWGSTEGSERALPALKARWLGDLQVIRCSSWVWASTESRQSGKSKDRHKAFLNQGPSFLHRQIDLYNRSWATNWLPAPSSTETSNLKSSISHNREFGGAWRDSIFSPRRHPSDCDVDQLGNSNEDHLSMKKDGERSNFQFSVVQLPWLILRISCHNTL